jgi:isopentenyl diphosphate isomerase/L-lactate dehydrogenase-like FMN-dependent dehydrogenase
MNQATLAKRALNIHDLRELARRRLPRVLFEYLDRGVEDEIGIRRNREALDQLSFLPRVLRDVSQVDTSLDLFGVKVGVPIGIGATAGASMFHYDGDVLLARAAKAAGVPFMISGATLTPLERIAEVGGRHWYQFYPWRNREPSYRLIDQARAVGCEALVLTVDTASYPNREYNIHNGFSWPVKLSLRVALDAGRKPDWTMSVLFRNLLEGQMKVDTSVSGGLGTDNFTWEELGALRRRWHGPLLLKGIVRPEEARRAVEMGCDGVIVSNHGGRNLDHALATADALPRVLEAVNARGAVLFDSGVRRGSDVVKALALGASFVFVGRAPLFGLSAAGEAGAVRALSILGEETRRIMGFLGCASIAELTPDLITGATAAMRPLSLRAPVLATG